MSPAKQINNAPKRSRGRPKLEDAADIDKLLLDAALAEFLEHGYGGASVSRMVRKVGISKTTVYSRFASKEEIFRAIIDRQITQLSPAELLNTPIGPLSLEEGLRRYAYHMLDVSMASDILGVNRLMYSESHRFPELGAAASMRTQLGIKRIAQFIHGCTEREGAPCRDPHAAAEIFILAIRGWYLDLMITNRKVSAKQRKEWVDKSLHVLLSSVDAW